jgi:L-ascorbate metabolism protein UlaG (beta-lactamase superfamily)
MFHRHFFVGGLTALAFFAVSALSQDRAAAAGIEVLWLGQASTKITTVTGKVIVIDPFLKKNPKTPAKYKDLKALGKVDLILVTHGHFDHTADVKELAAMTGAKVVGNGAMPHQMTAFGMIKKGMGISMNKSGTITPLGPDIKIHMVPAEHSSALNIPNPQPGHPVRAYAGHPVGYVIELENGFTIYHSGDTGVYGDMALINALYPVDLAMISIGGHYTMDPKRAAYAMVNLVKPKKVLPIHYGTFGALKGTPAQLKTAMGSSSIEILDVQPGQAVKF